MNQQELQAYIAELRSIEDQFFRAVLNDSDSYMLGIRLVRAVADSLKPIADLATLVEYFQRTGSDYVIPIADTLGAPQVMLLDYQLALGAAFYLRSQEIQEDGARADLRARLDAARAQGQRWLVLDERETRRYGRTFFRRLEMRLSDGFGLYTASELDWEKGHLYVLEPMLLDTDTGQPRRGAAPPEPRQEFATYEELMRAVEALREKYA
ncbi:MAG: hypothetical protein ACJ8CR_33360 [Roseiflexaceae bacterium]